MKINQNSKFNELLSYLKSLVKLIVKNVSLNFLVGLLAAGLLTNDTTTLVEFLQMASIAALVGGITRGISSQLF